MATYTEGDYYSLLSAADLSTKRYYLVKTDTNGKAVLASAATDDILGVLEDGGRTTGDTVSVALINGSGTFKVKLGGDVTKGAYLTADSNGKAVATVTTGNRVFGRALAAGSNGDIIEYVKYNERHQ